MKIALVLIFVLSIAYVHLRGRVRHKLTRQLGDHSSFLAPINSFLYLFSKHPAKPYLPVEAFPELKQQQAHIERVLKTEEEQFAKTLEQGLKILEQDLAELKGTVIPGEVIFKLYDTFGFPMDLTGDIARERELTLDEEGFEREMQAQRERARSASAFGMDYNSLVKVDSDTAFLGYQGTSGSGKIIALFKAGQAVDSLGEGEEGVVVLDQTPFYAESGGQVGDCGFLEGAGVRFDVRDTTKAGGAFLHHGVAVKGGLSVGTSVKAEVDASVRQATALNHSATHLLHAALRQVLGEHVTQKGSLVDSQRLRFDFSHFEAITPAQLKELETIVNREVRGNSEVETLETDIETAKAKGAMALFGEKYGDQVRVLSMGGDFSVELCGGTHVKRTGDIGLFKITSEGGVAAGVRRIEAVTGEGALAFVHKLEQQAQTVASMLKGDVFSIAEKVQQAMDSRKALEKELEQLKAKLASAAGASLLEQVQVINGVKVLIAELKGADPKAFRTMVDELKNKLGSGILLLATAADGKVSLIAGVTSDLTGKVQAGQLIGWAAEQVGGKGGGKPDLAQAGGTDVAALPGVLKAAADYIAAKL